MAGLKKYGRILKKVRWINGPFMCDWIKVWKENGKVCWAWVALQGCQLCGARPLKTGNCSAKYSGGVLCDTLILGFLQLLFVTARSAEPVQLNLWCPGQCSQHAQPYILQKTDEQVLYNSPCELNYCTDTGL